MQGGFILKNDENLWGIFKVAGNLYAIDSTYIEGITREPEKITGVPDSPDYVRGIIRIRDKVTTLMDLRLLFDEPPLAKEYHDFSAKMDEGKESHIKWMSTLRECAVENKIFTLSTNSHQCDFGRWYDTYSSPVSAVMKQLKKLEEPHAAIHKEAELFNKYLASPDPNLYKADIEDLIQRADAYLTRIVTCLDGAKQVFNDSFKTMVILLKGDSKRNLGLIVDEIIGVESIGEIYDDSTLDKMKHSALIRSVASDENNENLLLLLNEEKVFQLSDELKTENYKLEEL